MLIAWIFLLAGISARLYRMGGIGKPYKSWHRDWLIPIVQIVAFAILAGFRWQNVHIYLIWLILSGLSLTTYFDEFTGEDLMWLHGFAISLAAIPLLWCGIHWYAIIGRAIALAVSFGFLNYYVNKKQVPHSDDIEEYSRGFLIIATLLTFLI